MDVIHDTDQSTGQKIPSNAISFTSTENLKKSQSLPTDKPIIRAEDLVFRVIRSPSIIDPGFIRETQIFTRYMFLVKSHCDKTEIRIKNQFLGQEAQKDLIKIHLKKIQSKVYPKIKAHFTKILNSLMTKTDFNELNISVAYKRYKNYYQRALKPYFVATDFIKQIHYKPLGYAGDFRMLDFIYREGKNAHLGLYEQLLDEYTANIALGYSVRDRTDYIKKTLNLVSSSDYKVLSLASGAAQEIYELAKENPSKKLELSLFDSENQALFYSENRIKLLNSALHIKTVHASIMDIIKMKTELEQYDLIYSLGLFDYLQDGLFIKLTRALYSYLKPKGKLIIGNMAPDKHSRAYMALIGEWYLAYRSVGELQELAQKSLPDSSFEIEQDKTGSQLYLTFTKS